MPGKYWKSVLQKARARGIEVLITPDEAWAAFLAQNGICVFTGIQLHFGPGQNASLDRCNSKLPYTKDNIQWVHKDINWMKNRFSNEKFAMYCNLVSKHYLPETFSGAGKEGGEA